jgi:hypothetical protein
MRIVGTSQQPQNGPFRAADVGKLHLQQEPPLTCGCAAHGRVHWPTQPTKELTKGGDLRFAQVDVLWSDQPFLRFNSPLGSKTPFSITGILLTLTVYSPGLRPRLVMLKATALGAHSLSNWGGKALAACESNPGWHIRLLYSSDYRWALWWSHRARGGGDAARAPTLHLHPGIYRTTEENNGKPSVRVVELRPTSQ